MSKTNAEDAPADNKFKECESIALKDTIWEISDDLKKFSREEAERIITSHGGTIQTDHNTPATHELKYAKNSFSLFGGGKACIFEPGFLGYIRSQVMFHRINPREANHYSLHKLALIFAGTMPWLQKEEYKELVQEFGGRVQKKVNVNTNYVVLGYKDVPEAVVKAVEEMKIQTLDEDGFIELLQTRKPPGLEGFGIGSEETAIGSTDGKDVEIQDKEKGGDTRDTAMPSEEKVVDKEDARKTKKTTTKKKSGAGVKKKPVEKQEKPTKKTAGGRNSAGVKASGDERWAGRLRSSERAGKSSTA